MYNITQFVTIIVKTNNYLFLIIATYTVKTSSIFLNLNLAKIDSVLELNVKMILAINKP